jgi:hypothetical protein
MPLQNDRERHPETFGAVLNSGRLSSEDIDADRFGRVYSGRVRAIDLPAWNLDTRCI